MAQLSYASDLSRAYAGQIADGGFKDVISALNSSGSDIAFGVFVSMGASPGEAKIPAAAGDIGNNTLGVSAQVTAQEPNAGNGHADEEVFPVLNKGRVWALAEETMAQGDDVYIRHTAGTFATLGYVRTDADTASAAQLTRAKVLDYVVVGSDKLALIELS